MHFSQTMLIVKPSLLESNNNFWVRDSPQFSLSHFLATHSHPKASSLTMLQYLTF